MPQSYYTGGVMRLALLMPLCLPLAAADVLMVVDEIPAMQVLARHLKQGAGLDSAIVEQPALPKELGSYRAVAVYVHGNLDPAAENAAIAYARAGGRLILLHHSISSGKRRNREWFPFLGVRLPQGDAAGGGYKWLDPVEWEMVCLAPGNPIVTRGVKYSARAAYGGRERPAIRFSHSEVYLNHVLTGKRTVLMGLKYRDAAGKVWEQPTAAWSMRAGKGTVLYFMAGHSAAEFEDAAYSRILVNAFAAR